MLFSKMKHFASLCIFLILVHFSTQIPKYENCPEDIMNTHTQCECCKVTCSSAGSGLTMQAIGCAPSRCRPGTQTGYHAEDNTKQYPDCCGYPICN